MPYNNNDNNNKNQAALPSTTLIWTAIFAVLTGVKMGIQMLVFTTCLGGSIALYYFIKDSKNLLLKALKNVLFPLNIGLGLFWIMYLCIALSGFFSPSKIHNIEEILINARLSSKSWLNISYAGFILMLVVLFIFNLFLPRWKIISKYLKLRQYMVYTVVILSTLCTFTFFSQFPSDKYIAKHHAQRIEDYKILLRDDFKSVGDYIAAKLIEKAINEIEGDDIETYNHAFVGIVPITEIEDDDIETYNHAFVGRVPLNNRNNLTQEKFLNEFVSNQLTELNNLAQEKFLDELVSNQLTELNRNHHTNQHEDIPKFSDKERQLIEAIPETVEHKNKQKKIIAKKTIIVDQNRIVANEAMKAVEALFINTIGLTVPGAEDIGGRYMKKLIQECSKATFKSLVVKKFGLLKKLQDMKLADFQIVKFNSFLKPKWNNSENSVEELISNIKAEYKKNDMIGAELREFRRSIDPSVFPDPVKNPIGTTRPKYNRPRGK